MTKKAKLYAKKNNTAAARNAYSRHDNGIQITQDQSDCHSRKETGISMSNGAMRDNSISGWGIANEGENKEKKV